MRVLVLAALLCLSWSYPIEHVVVLMEENRSFDHMLGFMRRIDPRIDGLFGNESNPRDVHDPSKGSIKVNDNAFNTGPYDPCHAFECTTEGIFGVHTILPLNLGGDAKMDGFVQTSIGQNNSGINEMSMWAPENVPIIVTLAQEFAVFDKWFAAHPGPTYPNRQFVHSGTAHGELNDEVPADGFPQECIYKRFNDSGLTWKMYWEGEQGLAWALFLAELRDPANKNNLQPMDNFYLDAARGTLPTYSFVEPRITVNTSYKGPSFGLPNHQHPDASVLEGERLMKDMYEALRAGPLWNKTLFIIMYDEHGGFYDHVSPPQRGVPRPDDVPASNGFIYERLGIRVPVVMISPWIEKGTLVSAPPDSQKPTPTSQWEHSSIPATMRKMFSLGEPLTKRDAWAATFEHLVETLTEPRTDCPMTLPALPPPPPGEYERLAKLPLNHIHHDQISALCHMNGRDEACGSHVTCQGEVASFVQEEWEHWMRS